jgi:hypothetical protein
MMGEEEEDETEMGPEIDGVEEMPMTQEEEEEESSGPEEAERDEMEEEMRLGDSQQQ